MRKALLYLLLPLFLLPAALPAQVQALRPDCDSLYRAGEKLMAKPNPPLEEALRCYLNALNCNSALSGKIGPKIQDIFDRIKRQQKKATDNLAKANRLIRHFNFQGEKAAWAYKNGKFAVINLEGDTLTDFVYESPEPFFNDVALTGMNNQYFFIGADGQEKEDHFDFVIRSSNDLYFAGDAERQYLLNLDGSKRFEVLKSAKELEKGMLEVVADGKQGKICCSGKIAGSKPFDSIGVFTEGLAPVLRDGKWGFIDTNGAEIVPLRYDFVNEFVDGVVVVNLDGKYSDGRVKGGRWGIIDKKGTQIVPLEYDFIRKSSNGLIPICKNNKWGILDQNGKLVVAVEYVFVTDFSEGLGWLNTGGLVGANDVVQGGIWHLVNKAGKELNKVDYQWVGYFSEGRAPVYVDGKWGFVDTLAQEIIAPQFDQVFPFSNKKAIVNIGGRRDQYGRVIGGQWKQIGLDGKELSRNRYDEVEPIEGGFFKVRSVDQWGLLNSAGQETVVPKYDDIDVFEYGLALVIRADSVGLIDSAGVEVIPLTFDEIEAYDSSFVLVLKDNKMGAYDVRGKKILTTKYDGIRIVSDRLLAINQGGSFNEFHVVSGGKWGLHDKNGNPLTSPKYDQILEMKYGLIPVTVGATSSYYGIPLGGKWGFLDTSGSEIIPPIYDGFKWISQGIVGVYKDQKWLLLNALGQELVATKYDYVGPYQDGLAMANLGGAFVNPQMKGGKWGFIDAGGRVTIPIKYDAIRAFYHGVGAINIGGGTHNGVVSGGKWGMIDRRGHILVKPEHEWSFYENRDFAELAIGDSLYYCLWSGNKWTSIDSNGRSVVLPEKDTIFRVKESLPKTDMKNEGEGLPREIMDIVSLEYIYIDGLVEGIPEIAKTDCFNRPNRIGEISDLWLENYKRGKCTKMGMFPIVKENKWGFQNKEGIEIVTPYYDAIGNSNQHFVAVNIGGTEDQFGRIYGGKWGFIDTTGAEVVAPQFGNYEWLTNGMVWVRTFDSTMASIPRKSRFRIRNYLAETLTERPKWSLIDEKGHQVFEEQYEEVLSGMGRFFFLYKDDSLKLNRPSLHSGKWGLLDIKNMNWIPAQYDTIGDFFNGIALISKNGKYGLIDITSRELLPCIYTFLQKTGYRIYLTEQNGHYGLFAPDYHILIPANYEKIGFIDEENHWIRVQQNGKWGWVDYNGKTMIPCRYDAASPFRKGRAEVLQLPYPDFFYINTKGEMLPGLPPKD